MRTSRCRECQFWVNRLDAFCPNCGVALPAAPLKIVERCAAQQTIALLAGCASLALVVSLFSTNRTVGGNVIGCVLLTLSGGCYGVLAWKIRRFERRAANSLAQDERRITQRLIEIAERQANIQALPQALEGTAEPTSAALCATIEQAFAILQTQARQYQLKQWDIALIRWSNTLRPLLDAWNELTPELCRQYLHALPPLAERGAELFRQRQALMPAADDETEEPAELSQALNAIRKLSDTLQAKQVALTIQGIGVMDDTFCGADSAIEELMIFNALADLHQFSSSFQALEAAYCLVKRDVTSAD